MLLEEIGQRVAALHAHDDVRSGERQLRGFLQVPVGFGNQGSVRILFRQLLTVDS